jgi:hypothetical protein
MRNIVQKQGWIYWGVRGAHPPSPGQRGGGAIFHNKAKRTKGDTVI